MGSSIYGLKYQYTDKSNCVGRIDKMRLGVLFRRSMLSSRKEIVVMKKFLSLSVCVVLTVMILLSSVNISGVLFTLVNVASFPHSRCIDLIAGI